MSPDVSGGSRTISPLKSGRIFIWQDRREVSIAPDTTSRIRSSLSEAGDRRGNHSLVTMTWQLPQAIFPPHVPLIGNLLSFAITMTDTPSGALTCRSSPLAVTNVTTDKRSISSTETTARVSNRNRKEKHAAAQSDFARPLGRRCQTCVHIIGNSQRIRFRCQGAQYGNFDEIRK